MIGYTIYDPSYGLRATDATPIARIPPAGRRGDATLNCHLLNSWVRRLMPLRVCPCPVTRRNTGEKCCACVNPHSRAISVMSRFRIANRFLATSIRRERTHRCGLAPGLRENALRKRRPLSSANPAKASKE